MNYFIFNGESSADYDCYIGGQNTFNAPQRDVTKVSIPGRNGDLVRDNGRFLNVLVPYNIVIMEDFAEKARLVRDWLYSVKGYARLEDTYHPNHYRMARVSDALSFETSAYNLTGRGKVIFDCMPQRFLKSGETAQTFSASGSILNPTRFESRPLIRVNGSGNCSVTIGSQIITLTGVDGYVDIDSEAMDCYKGVVNCNAQVTLGVQGFPVLQPGLTGVAFSGGTTSVSITGRWWEL